MRGGRRRRRGRRGSSGDIADEVVFLKPLTDQSSLSSVITLLVNDEAS